MAIKNLADIEKKLGLNPGEFKTFYEDAAEKEVDISGLEIVKKTDLELRMTNIREEAKTAGLEVAVKNAREKLGLDFTGKTIDNLVDAYGKKVLADAKIDPDKKVIELTTDLDALRKNNEAIVKERDELKTTFKQKEDSYKVQSTILGKLPKTNTIIAPEEMAVLFNTKYSPKLGDNGALLFHDSTGAVMKNPTTLNPMTIDEIVPEFQTPYMKPASGGGGGGDNAGAKGGTWEAFDKEMETAGISVNSEKYNQEMQKRIKEKTLVV